MAIFTGRLHGIALAAGAGGLELGVSLALPDYRTVCWCERDAYAASALVARMEDAALDKAPIWSDLTTFDGEKWRGKVGILTAGYPCQPFSQAGKRLGDKDPRHLWPHVRRILAETEAPLLFAENVYGHVSLGLEEVWKDLQNMGYEVEAGIFSAAEVGASHIRKRLFILAYTSDTGISTLAGNIYPGRKNSDDFGSTATWNTFTSDCLDSALDNGVTVAPCEFPPDAGSFDVWEKWLDTWPSMQPAVPREYAGLAYRLDRYRLAGNGVCPLAAAYAFCTLAANATKRCIA